MISFLTLSQLSNEQVQEYRNTVQAAFPAIIVDSVTIHEKWAKIEKYFPEYQLYAIDNQDKLIGFVNTIPFAWDKPESELPNDGWDWMVDKGIRDHESNIKANSLGGLQIVVTKEYLGKGFSKTLIKRAKKIQESQSYRNLFIPIRPTFKQHHAEMSMSEYIAYKKEDKIYDPWIRTHLNAGAGIVKVCENSMNVKMPLDYWEKLTDQKITKSGALIVEGALSPVNIDLENNVGEYREPNIWISY